MNPPLSGLLLGDPRAELGAGRRAGEARLRDGESSRGRGGFRRGFQD